LGCSRYRRSFGFILLGVFASTKVNSIGGIIEGNFKQFGIQILGEAIVGIYTFVVSYAILKILDKIEPIRVPELVEKECLDKSLHGEDIYKFY